MIRHLWAGLNPASGADVSAETQLRWQVVYTQNVAAGYKEVRMA